mmetsp:Transcript_38106/g.62290  ORF Transcript_38106/g.62290 Transcript_38106/m.62290 type:complete len:145 (+) Transcript_38106:49-483(+)
MKPKIEFKNIWFDNEITELKISVCDGVSNFSNTVYISKGDIKNLIKPLIRFGEQIHGGIYDIILGEKGHEFANGVFDAKLHFYSLGKISIMTFQQSVSFEFKETWVASESKMFLTAEPSSLDNFVNELKNLESEIDSLATLVCT